MSLKQKYTWNQFKREQGAAAKELKRTSPEGIKAFAAAKKAKTKEYVQSRLTRLKKEKDKAEKAIDNFKVSLKGLRSASRRQAVLKRISRKQHAIRRFALTIEKDQSREL